MSRTKRGMAVLIRLTMESVGRDDRNGPWLWGWLGSRSIGCAHPHQPLARIPERCHSN